MIVHACYPSYKGSLRKRITVQADLGINTRPYLKNNKTKRAGGVTQVVEYLPSKCKVLSSNPSTKKKGKVSGPKERRVAPFSTGLSASGCGVAPGRRVAHPCSRRLDSVHTGPVQGCGNLHPVVV
jgi:hypothetical protein